jgi:hypothetical protein
MEERIWKAGGAFMAAGRQSSNHQQVVGDFCLIFLEQLARGYIFAKV